MGLHIGLHAVFKRLLFVGVGLVIIIVFHDQDFRGMVFGGEWAGVLVIVILSRLWSLLGLTYFRGWVTKDGYMEFLTSESLGFVLWLVSMVALSRRGVYCFKLGRIVVGSRVGKISLIQG